MKAKEALEILGVTRPTLTKYVKEGVIKVDIMPNGRYNYHDEDIYNFVYKGVKRKTYIYARVSTRKQKKDLDNQIEQLKHYCFSKGYKIDKIFSDIVSGISFEKRTNFFNMLEDILDNKVEKVVITYKDRLSRVGFDLFRFLFLHYNCEIEIISCDNSEVQDSKEIFEEIVSLLHCYSMKLYSKRKVKKLKEVLEEDK